MRAFLVASPEAGSSGGGFNGGRLVLEVPEDEVTGRSTFVHELFHALLTPHRREVERAAAACPGLDAESLEEALSYAVAPGLASDGPGDPLAEVVSRESSLPFSNSYARFRRFGLALRNPLSATLQRGGRLSDLLEHRSAYRTEPGW